MDKFDPAAGVEAAAGAAVGIADGRSRSPIPRPATRRQILAEDDLWPWRRIGELAAAIIAGLRIA